MRKCLTAATLVLITLFSMSAQPTTQSGWKLVWADEFDQASAPDSAKWEYEVGYLRNGESQYYTKDRRENARIQDGKLILEARQDSLALDNGKIAKITSAAIQTRHKISWTYGRIEVRAKVLTGRGTWPAIWMMPDDHTGGWPACGEIDIMENVGFDRDVVHQTIHSKISKAQNQKGHASSTTIRNLPDDFHIYAMEWRAEKIEMSIDGKSTFAFANDGTGPDSWPFSKPFYLILNLAIGGSWGGAKGIDPSIFPARMEVDYVRVYQHE